MYFGYIDAREQWTCMYDIPVSPDLISVCTCLLLPWDFEANFSDPIYSFIETSTVLKHVLAINLFY